MHPQGLPAVAVQSGRCFHEGGKTYGKDMMTIFHTPRLTRKWKALCLQRKVGIRTIFHVHVSESECTPHPWEIPPDPVP